MFAHVNSGQRLWIIHLMCVTMDQTINLLCLYLQHYQITAVSKPHLTFNLLVMHLTTSIIFDLSAITCISHAYHVPTHSHSIWTLIYSDYHTFRLLFILRQINTIDNMQCTFCFFVDNTTIINPYCVIHLQQ
eukprot:612168_1